MVDVALGQSGLEFTARSIPGLPEGSYVYELTLTPPPDMPAAQAQASIRERVISGAFTLVGGQIVTPATSKASPVLTKATVVADDQIVQGSLCVGASCANNESFGFDTIRLKSASPRIHFQDTSTNAFPTNDWRLLANDGGSSNFALDDVTSGNRIFSVTAGAPNNSLYVAANGKIGLRTATPMLDIHAVTSDTPAIRMEQTNSGGYTPQTWDIGANEANFFVRDITGGNKLPFRIRPGAPTSSLDIAASGYIGVGTASPSTALHVTRTDGQAKLLVEEANSSNAPRTLLELSNNGSAAMRFTTDSNTGWDMTAGSALTLATQGASTPQFSLQSNGNLTITGTLSNGSSRLLKTAIVPVDGAALLDKVLALPIYHWRYKTSPAQELHVGPMAEDFRQMFHLGHDDRSLAPADLAGVTLGAVQALAQKVQEREADIAAIKARISALEALVMPGTNASDR
ncbi:tail fiber domain-containing protein (plasmid) [Diaphorobacter sp. HDW4B]|uniref:tail fiber domain-containing protein n=1 Tax=Diaphorobacter sp. HDW4B TaxID=2714925 RepID=UPI00140D2B5C|nr:tail fiber domain-containing protein [Diaphorobacter sp. HDW4B]QIL74282.1 tail fiber domain-containing protein [Diaphorobacter sp. HDW4B]